MQPVCFGRWQSVLCTSKRSGAIPCTSVEIPGPWKPTCMLGVLCITQLNESLLVTKREPRVLKFQLHGS